MTSGVRKFTFSRAVVPLEIRFVLTIKTDGAPAEYAYWRSGPLGFSKAADVIIRLGLGSGVFESSTRCTFDPSVASSGCELAIFTGVPIFTRAKNFGAASPCKRIQPCVRGYGCTNPWWKPYAGENSHQNPMG